MSLLYNYHRQEKLEQLAEKFGRKASLRESWLSDMNHVLDELDKGHDVHAVDAALKRHEAISADIQAGVSLYHVVEFSARICIFDTVVAFTIIASVHLMVDDSDYTYRRLVFKS